VIHYWFAVLAQAISSSLEIIGHTVITIIYGLAVIVITAFRAWRKRSTSEEGWGVFFRQHLGRTMAEMIPICLVSWMPFFIWFLLATPYQMQSEAKQGIVNSQRVQEEEKSGLVACRSDLKESTAKVSMMDSQIRSEQTTLTAQQETINSQQSTLNSQQGTVNTCVVTLAKTSVPEPLKTTILMMRNDPNPKYKHESIAFLTTNKPITPVNLAFGCTNEIKAITIFPGTGVMIGGSEPVTDGHIARVSFSSPAWSPGDPLFVRIWYDGDSTGNCSYRVF